MKVGDLIKLHYSKRRCGEDASKLGVILDLDHHRGNLVNFNQVINVRWIVLYEDGMTDGCYANEAEVINESR